MPGITGKPALEGFSAGVYRAVLGRKNLPVQPEDEPDEARRKNEKSWLSEYFQIPENKIYFLEQVHGSTLVRAEDQDDGPLYAAKADAIYTFQKGRLLVVRTADCLPVFVHFLNNKGEATAAAIIHAGWRGIVADIVGSTLESMIQAHKNSSIPFQSIHISTGPKIGAESYEVGPEVATQFQRVKPGKGDRSTLDLEMSALDRIQKIQNDHRELDWNIHGDFQGCTFEENDYYFSHRKKDRERNLNLIMIPDEVSTPMGIASGTKIEPKK